MTEKEAPSRSELPIKLIVRRKGFEISTEGTISSIYSEIDSLAELTDKIAERLEIPEEMPEIGSEVMPSPEEVAVAPTVEIPVIRPSGKTMENLELLFDTPWGRTPRSVAEVMKALDVNAVPERVETVSIYLRRLTARGRLRRIEKEGKWVYYKVPRG